IVDEVLAVGDAEFQKKCLGKMADFAKSGRTVLFVSHQMAAVQALCSHAVFIERGRVRSAGLKARIIAEYIATASQSTTAGDWVELPQSNSVPGWRARFTAVRVGNDVPEAAYQCFPDGPAQIDVRVVATENISPVYLSVALNDRFGTRLVCPNTHRCRTPLRVIEGENLFRLDIESLHLTPGDYQLELWLADSKAVLDSVPIAARVAVSEYLIDTPDTSPGLDGIVTCRFTAAALAQDPVSAARV
ncbi:MAG TPA: hypothetical protein VMZ71_04330, partial [Gemmataceae bacterium]|nr:hypothetical protein [Gemmataceae bacterium]